MSNIKFSLVKGIFKAVDQVMSDNELPMVCKTAHCIGALQMGVEKALNESDWTREQKIKVMTELHGTLIHKLRSEC